MKFQISNFNSIFKNSVVILILASLAACGGSDSPAPGGGGGNNPAGPFDTGITAETIKALYPQMINRKPIASQLDVIPEQAALLNFISKREDGSFGLSQCSSSLIGPDLILTNSHCIPNEIKYKQVEKNVFKLQKEIDCKGIIVAHFPTNVLTTATDGYKTFDNYAIDCETVLFASDNEKRDVGMNDGFQHPSDYAVIKLAKPVNDRGFLDVGYDGIQANQKLYTLSFDPPNNTNPASINGYTKFYKKTCTAIEKSQLLKNSEYPVGRSILLADCSHEVIKGNSGSAIVDATNTVRGALWGGPAEPAQLKQNYNPKGEMPLFTYVTSSSCMNVPGALDGMATDSRCTTPSRNPIAPNFLDFYDNNFEDTVVENSSNSPMSKFFKYKVRKDISVHKAGSPKIGEPVCISDMDGFEAFLSQVNSYTGPFELNVFEMRSFNNKYLQPSYELVQTRLLGDMFYSVTDPFGSNKGFQLDLLDNVTGERIFDDSKPSYNLEECE